MITEFQKFEVETIKRSQINFAYYNPRKISDDARKKLKKKIKEGGLKQALVWNRQTGNLVSGHQRLSIIDQLEKNSDFEITVNVLNESIEEEIKENVFFNNTSAMGEMDKELLLDLTYEFPELDLVNDMGFDVLDLKYMGLELPKDETAGIINENVSNNLQAVKELDMQHKISKVLDQGDSHLAEQNDYILTIVFNNNIDKQDFCGKIGIERKEKYIKFSKIYDNLRDEMK